MAAAALAQNPVAIENQNPGVAPSTWYAPGPGDANIQGFATDISVDRGNRVHFKIDTDSPSYHIDIYRLGWYQGLGARLVGTGVITATLPQVQPAPIQEVATAMTDCGNWAESAHWDVPATACSGIHLAKLVRDDATPGTSNIVFVVRDDASTSDIVLQTSDATWQAYNVYGGASTYPALGGHAPGFNHATKVSYNRPFDIRHADGSPGDDVFAAEYAMVRWLERNGYDVSYTTCVDGDRSGSLIANHRLFLSVGHDEYWSLPQRAAVTAARDAGTNLAFFSGNEVYWKIRFEPSIDGAATPHRTLVCFKEGTLGENGCGTKCDPSPQWTGLWRDGCAPTYSTDACAPESMLTGQFGWDGTIGAIQVPSDFKDLRFWRHTTVATMAVGNTATLAPNSLGSEWDWQQAGVPYPPRRVLLSSTVLNGRTHHLSLYRADSGALVFGAGTIQWSWGLDAFHTFASSPIDADMQQATVNLFADMGVAPATLQNDLVAATASTDTAAPASMITSPLDGSSTPRNATLTIVGVAADTGGGVVAGVEVSTDGGLTWQAAQGTTVWTYAWTPTTEGSFTIRSRAYDDTLNIEPPASSGAGNLIAVTVTPPVCPCRVFGPAEGPLTPVANDGQPIELGMRFRVASSGVVTALRYYKPVGATGLHTGNLWTNGGLLLASAPFVGETASGWQQVDLPVPVPVAAGTTYVVSYFSASGDYAATLDYFTVAHGGGGVEGLADGFDGSNGVYRYAPASTFPTDTFRSANYWADVVFDDGVADTTPPTVAVHSPASGATGVAPTVSVTATFSEDLASASVTTATFELQTSLGAPVAATVSYDGGLRRATLQPLQLLAPNATYTAVLRGGSSGPRITDLAGNALANDVTWTFTTAPLPACPCTVLGALASTTGRFNDSQSIELGMKFRSDYAGFITALRYYKPVAATGAHEGHLWTAAGTLLASVPFTDETPSGWQEALLPVPVAVAAGTTYVVSYFSSSGDYTSQLDFFTASYGSGFVHGLADGVDGPNGVFAYSPVATFPTGSFRMSNYFADVVLYRTEEARSEIAGAGCAGTGGLVPTLTALGLPPVPTQPNPTFGLALAGGLPLAPAVFALGGLPGTSGPCELRIGAIDQVWFAMSTAAGTATIPAPVPPSPVLLGVTVWMQAGVLDAAAAAPQIPGLALTNGLRLYIGSE